MDDKNKLENLDTGQHRQKTNAMCQVRYHIIKVQTVLQLQNHRCLRLANNLIRFSGSHTNVQHVMTLTLTIEYKMSIVCDYT